MSKKGKKIGSGKKDLHLRIWNIRDLIQTLEDIKDEIIAFLTKNAEVDDNTLNFWVIDVKEAYFCIVAAWEMLHGISKDVKKYAPSAKAYLALGKSRLAQCTSELIVLGTEGNLLSSKYTKVFEKCWNVINAELQGLIPITAVKPPTKRVIKVSDDEYNLCCSICGKVATSFRIGNDQFTKKQALICTGLVHKAAIRLTAAEKIFTWLDQEDIAHIHSFLKDTTIVFEEGLDAYCPKCDKIYCEDHYTIREEWDEGFYDCTYGTCPENHTRMIHD